MGDTTISEAAVEAAESARAMYMQHMAELSYLRGHAKSTDGDSGEFDADDVREKFEEWAKGRDLTPDTWGVSSYVSPYVDNDWGVWRAAWKALAATGKQQAGDDGLPMIYVTQEFKDQADHDAEISSAASNLLRNNTLGLSGSLPEMVAALLKLASGQQAGEVQEPVSKMAVRKFIADRAPNDEHREDILSGDYDHTAWFDHIRELMTALSARQPWACNSHKTEQPVAFVGSDGRPAWIHDGLGLGKTTATAVGTHLYAAPTEQGIDLGQFRNAVKFWRRERARMAACNNTHTPEMESSPADDVKEADRLLALIDQRDAAPGVDQ